MAAAENHLIKLLSGKDRKRLVALCEPTDLVLGDLLYEPSRPMRHAYFPVEGFISLLTLTAGSPALEVGMVGREGMLGAQLALGVAKGPLRAVVQGAGTAWRIGADAFRLELARSPGLQAVVDRYLGVLMAQLATSAGCLRFHLIGPRLARWLLMSRDRAQSDHFRVTHEFLAFMLGVRRVGITTAASALQRSGLITYSRGNLTVIDRHGLEAAACGCLLADRQAYASLMR